MQIRKNTRTFKTILEIVTTCQARPDREKLIRLYITRVGDTVRDRIPVEGIQGDSALFYEMNYQSVLNSLRSSNHQLNMSDDLPGIYFFHTSSNKAWDETPFEFDEAIKKEFDSLQELPVMRKKEKVEKVVMPSGPKTKTESKEKVQRTPSEKTKTTKAAKATKKEKPAYRQAGPEPQKVVMKVVYSGPKQPDYKLKHKIQFTNLDRIILRQAQLTKKDVLDYYNSIAEYILPYLKDRPQRITLHSESGPQKKFSTLEALKAENDELPDWLQTIQIKKGGDHLLLCSDKEHLLFYVEMGCVQFNPCHSRTKSIDAPDYIVIAMDTDAEFTGVIDVAQTAQVILTGLQLPSFVKTAASGLHLYIPLDSKSSFETAKHVAEYICKLIRLKIPNRVSIHGTDDQTYGKVSLDFTLNDEAASAIASYSLTPTDRATIATPLDWDEVKEGLRVDDFNHETIFKRLKKEGDVLKDVFKKKVNGDAVLERLEEGYGFLV